MWRKGNKEEREGEEDKNNKLTKNNKAMQKNIDTEYSHENTDEKKEKFHYDEAFSRNIGWVTQAEQNQLRFKKIAIAGMGGVGGIHLLTLTRLGIGRFHIADLDCFEQANFNRQAGAMMSTLHEQKTVSLEHAAKDINPELEIKRFDQGISEENLDEFLKDVDLYVDGLDAFELTIRAKVFKRCAELNIPAITAGPIGMSAAYLIFMPGKMTFEEYFCFSGLSEDDKRINFILGLSPKMHAMKYLVEPSAINFKQRKGPSIIMACQLCAGVIGTEALKILLHRGPVYAVPYYHFFDAFSCKYHRGKLYFGNRNPIQKIKHWIFKKVLNKKSEVPSSAVTSDLSSNNNSNANLDSNTNVFTKSANIDNAEIYAILDLARWTPSGDNFQPWRFKIIDANHVNIYISDEPDKMLLMESGKIALLTAGMLLESMRLAASRYGRKCEWNYLGYENNYYEISVNMEKDPAIKIDTLFSFITSRSVRRGRFHSKKISEFHKALLELSLEKSEKHIAVEWKESVKDKHFFASLNVLTTKIKLNMPEFFHFFKRSIDFEETKFSEDKMPLGATGLNPISQQLMKWVSKNEKRYFFMNHYFRADLFSAMELEYFPGLSCGAYFFIRLKNNITHAQDNILSEVEAGEIIQRFWLKAESLGLVIQPCYAIPYFNYYRTHSVNFTQNKRALKYFEKFKKEVEKIKDIDSVIFAGRIGYPRSFKVTSRSLRKPLESLLIVDKVDKK